MSDLLTELGAVNPLPASDGWYTSKEIGRALGLSEKAVLRKLGSLHEAGRLECQPVQRMSITGKPHSAPAYRLREG